MYNNLRQMQSISFLNIITHMFNAYCVAVHKTSDPICGENCDQSHVMHHMLNFITTSNLRPRETCFSGPTMWQSDTARSQTHGEVWKKLKFQLPDCIKPPLDSKPLHLMWITSFRHSKVFWPVLQFWNLEVVLPFLKKICQQTQP